MLELRRRRRTWRRILTNPVIAAEVAFVAVVTGIGIVAISPIGASISLAIATHDNPGLVASLVAGTIIITTALLIGATMVAFQILARHQRRTS
ncbi:hypothetical protein [Microcella sp.]|uniref:hypothetical protein n=1 Tax=Microcella sp. TaxID=1913979 RepID=UPI00391AEE10